MITTSIKIRTREQAELHCWKNYYTFCPTDKKKALGIVSREIGPFQCFAMPSHDILAFNRAVYTGRGPITERALEQVRRFYNNAGSKRMMIQIPSLWEEENMKAMLQQNGFAYHNRWVKLEASLTRPIKPIEHNLFIRKATQEDRDMVAAIIACAFGYAYEVGYLLCAPMGLPDWHYYIAYRGKEPIAISGLHIHQHIASMTIAATPAYARGFKAQQAQLVHRCKKATLLRCRHADIETGEDKPGSPNISYHNAIKQEFKPLYYKNNYTSSTHPAPCPPKGGELRP